MATREAGIKVTLDSGSIFSGLDAMGKKAQSTGQTIKSGLQAGFKGVGGSMMSGGKDAFKDLAGGLKNTIGQVATLGGGIGFGMLIKRASDLRAHMREIEFSVNKTGQQTADWRDLMAGVQSATDETGQSSDKLAEILTDMWEGGGDIDFAKKALIPVGHAAQASGKDLKQLAGIATMLQEKFGATAETLPDMLAAIIQKTDQGGLSLAAMGDKFGLLAGEAADAGFAGAEGMLSVVGMLNALDDRLGDKSIPSFKKLFQVIKDGSSSLKAIGKESGLKFDQGMSGADKLRTIVASDKGRKAMSEKLGGEQRVVFDLLAKPFQEAFDNAKASGAKTKDATNAGLAAWDKAMQAMGEASLGYADILEHSKDKQQHDPQIKLNKAIDKIAEKFTEPQMLEALDQLSTSLPKVANAAIKLIDFATKHPALAAGALVGGKVGGGMVMGAVSKLGENIGSAISGALKSGAQSLAADIKQTMTGGASSWGKAMGAAFGIAGAAIVATEIGKAIIDARIAEKERSAKESFGAGIEATNAINKGDQAEMAAAREKLAADLNRQRDDYNSFSKSGLDPMFNMLAGLVDSDYKAPEMTQMTNTVKQIAELDAALAALSQKAQAAAKSSEDMATGTKKAGQAAGAAAQQLNNISGNTNAPDTTGNGHSKGPGGNRQAPPGYAAGG